MSTQHPADPVHVAPAGSVTDAPDALTGRTVSTPDPRIGARSPWNPHHFELDSPLPYGDPQTYVLAAEWVRGCERVEDWGCGGGGLREHVLGDRWWGYVGIDGSATPYADVVTELCEYVSTAEGIVVRHVLEHNHRWRTILDNAVESFTRRLCVVVFTPLVGETHVLHTEPEYGDVPVIAFKLDDLRAPFLEREVTHDVATVLSPWAHFGSETLIYAQR